MSIEKRPLFGSQVIRRIFFFSFRQFHFLLLGTDPFTFTQFAENWIEHFLCLCHSLNLNVSLQKCLLLKRAKKTFLCCFQQFPITIKPFFGWIFDQTKLSLHFFYASVVRHQHYHPFWQNLEGGRFFFFLFFLFELRKLRGRKSNCLA